MAKLDTSFKVKGEIYKDEESGRYMVLENKTGEHIDLEKYLDRFSGKLVDLGIKESKEVGTEA